MRRVPVAEVSAIMPTADRRRFVPQAIAAFLAQTQEDAELVILDDGEDEVADLVPDHPRIRYVRETERRILGDKRNRLCALARGAIILHWDDDDWHAPDRIARQCAALEATGADMCGLDRVIFLSDDGSAGLGLCLSRPRALGLRRQPRLSPRLLGAAPLSRFALRRGYALGVQRRRRPYPRNGRGGPARRPGP